MKNCWFIINIVISFACSHQDCLCVTGSRISLRPTRKTLTSRKRNPQPRRSLAPAGPFPSSKASSTKSRRKHCRENGRKNTALYPKVRATLVAIARVFLWIKALGHNCALPWANISKLAITPIPVQLHPSLNDYTHPSVNEIRLTWIVITNLATLFIPPLPQRLQANWYTILPSMIKGKLLYHPSLNNYRQIDIPPFPQRLHGWSSREVDSFVKDNRQDSRPTTQRRFFSQSNQFFQHLPRHGRTRHRQRVGTRFPFR